jgi:hypothetical protein
VAVGPETRGEPSPRHPDGELLDAYADGERTPGSVDRHVRSCLDCQDAVRALRNVRVELGRLAPVTMPPDVATRIQAALSAAPAVPAPAAGRSPRRGRGAAERRRPPAYARSRLRPATHSALGPGRSSTSERLGLVAVCLLVVVAGAGMFAVLHLHPTTSGSSATSSVARPVAADEAAGAAAPPSGGPVAAPVSPYPVAARQVRVADSGAQLADSGVVQHARDVLAGRVPTAAQVTLDPVAESGAADLTGAQRVTSKPVGGTVAAGLPPPTEFASGGASTAPWEAVVTPTLVGCYDRLAADVGGPVLALDRVSYQGRAAVLVVLDISVNPEPSTASTPNGGRLELAVVGLDCAVDHLATDTWYGPTPVAA